MTKQVPFFTEDDVLKQRIADVETRLERYEIVEQAVKKVNERLRARIEKLEKALHRAKKAMQAQNKSYDERLRLENDGLQERLKETKGRLAAAEEALKLCLEEANYYSDLPCGTVWTERHWQSANSMRVYLEEKQAQHTQEGKK